MIALLLQARPGPTAVQSRGAASRRGIAASEASANPNNGKSGLTPLMIAASSGQLEAPGCAGRGSASKRRERRGRCEVARMLVNCGAAATGHGDLDGRRAASRAHAAALRARARVCLRLALSAYPGEDRAPRRGAAGPRGGGQAAGAGARAPQGPTQGAECASQASRRATRLPACRQEPPWTSETGRLACQLVSLSACG